MFVSHLHNLTLHILIHVQSSLDYQHAHSNCFRTNNANVFPRESTTLQFTPPERKPWQSCYSSYTSIQHLLLPGRRKLLRALVVASQTVNTALDQNQTELGVTVLSVALEVLSHSDSLLDQEVHVLGERRSQTYASRLLYTLYRSSSEF